MTAPDWAWPADEGPDTQPTLEYQHAFDLCAVAMHRHARVGVLASASFYAYELLRRACGPQMALVDTGGWLAGIQQFPSGSDPACAVVALTNLDASCVIWAVPLADDHGITARQLFARQPPDAELYVIAHGALARFLPQRDSPYTRPASWWRVERALKQAGYAIAGIQGFHGASSILWSSVYRLFTRMGRDDLAARCLYQMRASYTSRGAGRYPTTINVLMARKGA